MASLDYAVNRSYSSGQGRFTSVDPAGEGLNQYAYVGNNPIDFVDPSGLNVEMPGTHHTSLDPMGVAYRVDGLD